ncbi:MAG: S8 family serine peptidase [Methylobacterium radiotolerans]
MARRTTRRPPASAAAERAEAAPAVGIMPVQAESSPGQPMPPAVPGGQETTGRYLVLMEPGGVAAGVQALTRRVSLRLASARESLSDPAGHLSMSDGGGMVFEDLGVAVVSAPPDQAAAISSAVAQEKSLRVVEPERVVYAIGSGRFDLSYLRGYRDAVNHLVDGILKGETAEGPNLAAAVEETAFTWGLQAVGVDRTRFTGRGIKVSVLDTGLDLSHPDFAGRAIQSRSFIDGVPTAQDGNGHGTHCAGIAAGPARPGKPPRFGVAPDVELFVGKVLDDRGRGADGSILAGIQWALSNGCDIISMSLGGPILQGQGYSAIFEQVAQRALARGTLILAAAGNDSQRPRTVAPVSHPANCPSILAVAAVDRALATAWFSNGSVNTDGGSVDIAGPGVDCRSTWIRPEQYKDESGTSMATPHVAGVAALIAESDPTARGAQLHFKLVQTARRLGGSAADIGAGLIQAPR